MAKQTDSSPSVISAVKAAATRQVSRDQSLGWHGWHGWARQRRRCGHLWARTSRLEASFESSRVWAGVGSRLCSHYCCRCVVSEDVRVRWQPEEAPAQFLRKLYLTVGDRQNTYIPRLG